MNTGIDVQRNLFNYIVSKIEDCYVIIWNDYEDFNTELYTEKINEEEEEIEEKKQQTTLNKQKSY